MMPSHQLCGEEMRTKTGRQRGILARNKNSTGAGYRMATNTQESVEEAEDTHEMAYRHEEGPRYTRRIF